MKCEICHKAEAVTAIKSSRNGSEYELYVCKACAEAASGDAPKPHAPADAEPGDNSSATIKFPGGSATITAFGVDGPSAPPPEIVSEILKTTLGIIEKQQGKNRGANPVCKSCGAKWEDISDGAGFIGCPACWTTFGALIRERYLSSAFGKRHCSRPPSPDRDNLKVSIEILRRELKEAVAREDFRRAAELKSQIDTLAAKAGEDSI